MLFRLKYSVVLVMLASLLLSIAVGASAGSDGNRTIIIPQVTQGPVMDGIMGDKLWASGALMSDFVDVSGSSKPIQQTTARLLYDSKNLYIGIKCSESNMAGISARARGADSSAWKDDCVELFLDSANTRQVYYHLIRTSNGAYYDLKSVAASQSNGNWTSSAVVKTGVFPGGWSIEIAIPFSDLGVSPSAGMEWGINVCRARQAGTQENSSWNPTRGKFDFPEYFGTAVFGDSQGKWDGIRILSWGSLDPTNALDSKNFVRCSIPNPGSTAKTFSARVREQFVGAAVPVSTKNVVVPANQTVQVDIPYMASTADTEGWALDIESDGKPVLDAAHSVVTVSYQQRVWQVTDPLFEELLSKNPAGLQKYGCIYWLHTYSPNVLPEFAQEYGIRYSNEEALKELADSKLLALRETYGMVDKFSLEMADKYKFKVLFYPDIMRWSAPDAPKIDGASFSLDPRSKAHYFQDLKDGIAKWRKYIWGVYTADEITESAMHQALRLYIDHKADYPFIRQVNEEVKRDFGFGKYGMPESLDDPNPYRWIALRRWLNNYMVNWQKEVYELVRSTAPEIKVISTDPVAGHKPNAWDQMSPYFDVATQQLYPPINPNRQQFGFTTKMVADLTGKPTWPCTHVENYAYSTTLDEVRELMSQVMRNGGKGFHWWLKDEQGNQSQSGFMM
ncbi:MAG TPA: sugar-binding protein, partial [Armatimonadota bacterium]